MSRALSPAQKRALLGIPVNREFIPEHTGFQWPTLAVLKARRLINGVRGGLEGAGPQAKHVITPGGRRLRATLSDACCSIRDRDEGLEAERVHAAPNSRGGGQDHVDQ